MNKLFSGFRANDTDSIRQSASMTMAVLLDQNRKFEVFMREKVSELETRVTAQQARLSEEPSAYSSQRSDVPEEDDLLSEFGVEADPAVSDQRSALPEADDFSAEPDDEGNSSFTLHPSSLPEAEPDDEGNSSFTPQPSSLPEDDWQTWFNVEDPASNDETVPDFITQLERDEEEA